MSSVSNRGELDRREIALLYSNLRAILKKKVEAHNQAIEAKSRLQVKIDSDTSNHILFVAKGYKRSLIPGRDVIYCDSHLDVSFKEDAGTVGWEADLISHKGILSIGRGADGSVAFFENSREISSEKASERILTSFLDNIHFKA